MPNKRVEDLLIGKALTSDGDAFSAASLENYVALNKQMRAEQDRHAQNAQRRERARWLGCGPESWCPDPCECDPCGEGEGEDVGGNTFINTTFTGDKAVAQLARLLDDSESTDPDPGPVPPPPPPLPPPPTPPDQWLLRLLALVLLLGTLITLLMLLAYWLFSSGNQELIAIPYQPPVR